MQLGVTRLVSFLAVLLGCCSNVYATETHTVRYYQNMAVTVPNEVQRVATSWEAQNAILAMLGYGNKIVATTPYARAIPAFRRFIPTIKDTPLSTANGSANVNVEQLIALRPDILFVADGFPPAKQKQLENAGIAVASFHANSMDALVERVGLTGRMLGQLATKRAEDYQRYFAHNRSLVEQRLSQIPNSQRLSVYVASGTPLTTSGRPSLNQDWIDLAGGINVAEQWHLLDAHHGAANVSLESVMAANPDVIVSMLAADANRIKQDPRWRNINAVKNGRVYANPRGLFYWCRESSEEALQFLWLAKKLYPTLFNDIDMHQETKTFYQRFFDITLSDKEVTEFLEPVES